MTELSRAERFLTEYASLEDHLRRTLNRDQGYPYKRLVEDMRKKGLVTDSQVQALYTFGYLRNALAHAVESGGEVIADPRQSAVDEFIALAEMVKAPPFLVNVVRHRVESLGIDEPLSAFTLLVKTRDFSQAPVLEQGRFVDMLTLGRLARWIADNRHYDKFDLFDTPIRSVLEVPLQAEEFFAVCDPDINLAQALNLFDFGGVVANEEPVVPVRGLLVLKVGQEVDDLQALVTFEDLPLMLRALGRGA